MQKVNIKQKKTNTIKKQAETNVAL